MSKMNELYAKVATDSALQEKFGKIVEEGGDEAAVGEKLITFAKDQGYDVTLSDIEEFFKSLAEPTNGQLSEEEMEAVAGGKSPFGGGSGISIGVAATIGGCGGGLTSFSLFGCMKL